MGQQCCRIRHHASNRANHLDSICVRLRPHAPTRACISPWWMPCRWIMPFSAWLPMLFLRWKGWILFQCILAFLDLPKQGGWILFFVILAILFFYGSQIVFSEAWWIGTKEENPEEARLDFPKQFLEVCSVPVTPTSFSLFKLYFYNWFVALGTGTTSWIWF